MRQRVLPTTALLGLLAGCTLFSRHHITVSGQYGNDLAGRVEQASAYVLEHGKADAFCGYYGKGIEARDLRIEVGEYATEYDVTIAIALKGKRGKAAYEGFLVIGIDVDFGKTRVLATYDGTPIAGLLDGTAMDGVPDLAIDKELSTGDVLKAIYHKDPARADDDIALLARVCTDATLGSIVRQHQVPVDGEPAALYNGGLEHVMRKAPMYVAENSEQSRLHVGMK